VLEPYSGNSFEIVSYYLQGKGISPLEMINLMKREYRELAKELNAPSCKPRFDTKEEEYLGSFHDPRESSHTPLRVLSLLNKVLFGEDNDYLLKLYYGSMESSV